ncbi:FliH/SctL family protein [Tepidibacter thalassicus]|uniref:Flagellar assembly protein FliH n=1 Tax=Tepidibacter thalassicus DSM 15285 TaxID=1123350 RepID=A0A1M5NSM5_9FIRM|nr:FliH/SctL family protein [Tepidibacter thalassicus]SHG92541.1 flagellar assembly protein FliH [Tepidibacter thalassicus DSM 15285]
MSRVIKSNQVKVINQKIVKFDSEKKIKEDPSNDIEIKKITAQIERLLIEKDEISNQIKKEKEMAQREKEEILNNAKIEYENILKKAEEESKVLFNKKKEEGYKQGYEDGYKKSIEEYNRIVQEALDVKNSVLAWKKSEINRLEKDLINLVIQSVEKIIQIKLKEDDNLVLNIIKEGLDKFTFTEKIIIRVSSDDFDVVNFSKDRILAMADHIDEMDVKMDSSLEKGEVIIDTNSGSINPGIKNQLEILKKEFLNLIQGDDKV